MSLTINLAALRASVNVALEKSERFRAWSAHEAGPLSGTAEENWPRFAEYELIEKQTRGIAEQLHQTTVGFETWESYIERYAGATIRAYDEGRITADHGDSTSPYRRLLAEEAKATCIWLRHVLDFLRVLESASVLADEHAKTRSASESREINSRVILFASASPDDRDRLRTDVEVREIRDELQRASKRGLFHLEARGACRPTDFVRDLLSIKPEIVHFSGHGAGSGALYFEDEAGGSKLATAQAISSLFAECSEFVKCVILNACFSEVQARAIQAHIPFVIGMRGQIEDPTAIAFAKRFYLALASTGDVARAYRLTMVNLELENVSGASLPVMIQSVERPAGRAKDLPLSHLESDKSLRRKK